MRFKSAVSCLLAVVFWLPIGTLQAQDGGFPTLAAWENAQAPTFDHTDMAGRMSGEIIEYAPPDSPSHYEVGDTEWFRLAYGPEREVISMSMELRAQTDRVLIWVRQSVDYPYWRAQAMASRVEQNVLNPVQKQFGMTEPPGIDGDPRLNIVLINDPDLDAWGLFARADTRLRRLDLDSNQREMVVVNLAQDENYDFYDDIMMDIIAHEYLHVLHFHSDRGEESWLDEALATFAAFHASKPFLSRSTGHAVADLFLQAPGTGLTKWQAVEDKTPKYGAGFLFMMYLAQRFGDDIAVSLLTEQANGWRSVSKVLREKAGVDADEVFADWVIANAALDARRGYGYRELDAELTPPQPLASINSSLGSHEGELPQYSTDYIAVDVRGAKQLFLRLRQEPVARLIDGAASEGERFYYAIATDEGNSRLTRAFDLSAVSAATLEYRIWYDLDAGLEYVYVMVSEDNGRSWRTLGTDRTSASNIYDDYFTAGYTGRSRYWLRQSINLGRFAPGQILIRFELVSDIATDYRGAALDDLRIETISFDDSFESPDDAWMAEGWIRTDNRLPNNTWLQVLQDTGTALHVSRALLTGDGELTVELLPGVSQALVAVSPIVPLTGLPTEYELEVNLMDAAGLYMTVIHDCSVTTTVPLNFRHAPNGNKIGLLPKGATVDALDRQDDWFQVDYNNTLGWVHADYVTALGNCP